MDLVTGGSFLWFQVVVLLTALYLKIKKPDFIDNIEALDLSVKYLIVTLIIPSITGLLSMAGGFTSEGFVTFFLVLKFIINTVLAVLVALSIYQLWISIKYNRKEEG